MTGERDCEGRLRVSFFVRLIRGHVQGGGSYAAAAFKQYVERLGVLRPADWSVERNGYAKWKHRLDRAAQKVFTNV
jgi:DNA invertase Pin-like site-specific DNA recombinase